LKKELENQGPGYLLVILEPSWSEVLQISGSLDFIESEND
jgi:hypothetical protein